MYCSSKAFVILTVFSLLSSIACAKEQNFRLQIGTSTNNYDSSIRVDSDEGQVNRPIVLEDQTNMDTQVSAGWLSGEWRFSPNHRVRFDYIPVTRTGKRQLIDTLEFHNVAIQAGSRINTELTTHIYDIDYVYNFYTTESSELGFSLGLYVSDLEVSLEAEGTIISLLETGASETQASYQGKRDLTAPLPLVGLTYSKRFEKNWLFNLNGRIWDMEIAGVDSSFYSAKASLEYTFDNNIGIGIASSYLDINLIGDKERLTGEVEISYTGVQVFLSASF